MKLAEELACKFMIDNEAKYKDLTVIVITDPEENNPDHTDFTFTVTVVINHFKLVSVEFYVREAGDLARFKELLRTLNKMIESFYLERYVDLQYFRIDKRTRSFVQLALISSGII